MHRFFGEPRTWVGIAFVIFFILFGSRLWRAVAAMLDQHAARVRSELDEASRLRHEAEVMLSEAKTRRDSALADARGLIESAHQEAARVGEQSRIDAEAASRRRERLAVDRIAAAEKAAVTEIRQAAAEIAARSAQDVIAATLSGEADAAIIDRAIAGLPAALSRRAA